MPHRGPLKGKHNYALQQTADRYVKRALPNHYLSLRTFSPVRHFPRGHEVFEADETQFDTICERIAKRLKQVTTTLLTNFDCVLPVTGGNDSRNLLACAADVLGQTKTGLFTHHINKMSGFDCMIGQDIGKVLGGGCSDCGCRGANVARYVAGPVTTCSAVGYRVCHRVSNDGQAIGACRSRRYRPGR
jgi:hypothetical protein